MAPTTVLAAPFHLAGPGHYLHWGVVQVSLANAVVVVLMLALFAAAVLVPFPKGREGR